ncbi:MAG: DMT family protein [Vampirovibrionales bacterium]|nr:DMT family protein [Vampirovibrionales bacterium]
MKLNDLLPPTLMGIPWVTMLLLVVSNVFMTASWYGHLKFPKAPLWGVVLLSWGIALGGYFFQIPANRIGYGTLSLTQLKVLQESISLLVFVIFSVAVFREQFLWNYWVAFALLLGAVFFATYKF